MGLNDTPSGERIHIGFFGRRNAGKSSIVNAVTGQDLSVVSDVKGTTTDPVYKAMELLPMGPVVIIDTPGYDDEGALGELRIKKTKQALNRCDCAVLVVDSVFGKGACEEELIKLFVQKNIPYILVYNKSDISREKHIDGMDVSAVCNENIFELKEKIAGLVSSDSDKKRLIGDFICESDIAVLVVPIDKSAPKGRLILPQQQVIRDILDSHALSLITQEDKLESALDSLAVKPKIVITDSQVFKKAASVTPDDIYLTSFSVLMARYKGFLDTAVKGVKTLDSIEDGDTVLISEGCTHHRQCEDIGTVKLPKWIREYTGKNVDFKFTQGREFPEDLSGCKMIIHCGGCMLNEREMLYRMKTAIDAGIPFTNYGITIAYLNGILKRSLRIFPNILKELD